MGAGQGGEEQQSKEQHAPNGPAGQLFECDRNVGEHQAPGPPAGSSPKLKVIGNTIKQAMMAISVSAPAIKMDVPTTSSFFDRYDP